MRKEIVICDVCKKEIQLNQCIELEIIADIRQVQKLGLEIKAMRRRGRRSFMGFIDVCSKACLAKFIEKLGGN